MKVKRKKYILVVVLALLFVIFATRLSFSQKELTKEEWIREISDLAKENELEINKLKLQLISGGDLSGNIRKLSDIMLDLLEIQKIYKSIYLQQIFDELDDINTIFTYETHFLFNCIMIKKEYEMEYYNKEIERLEIEKQTIDLNIKNIRLYYASVTNDAALHLIDKAKEIIRSSLELFDKSIEILKSNIELRK